MSDRSRHFLILILTFVFFTGTAHAQQKPASTEAEQAVDAALREKAFRVLYSVAEQLPTLQSAENRARIGSNLVGSLWKHDEQRAKNLLRLVEEDIRSELNTASSSHSRDQHSVEVFLQLRRDTVDRILKNDAEVALAFLKATEVKTEDQPYYVHQNELDYQLKLAKQIANDKPEIALQLGRKTMAIGLSNEVLAVLGKLLRKHREYGMVFYKEIVVKLRNSQLTQWPNLEIAQGLAMSFPPPDVDDSTYRELINLLMKAASDYGCAKNDNAEVDEYLCKRLTLLLPQMKRVDPVRAAQLERWGPDGEESVDSQKGIFELEDLVESGTTDEVLALATKYPELAGHIRSRAVQKAQAEGDLERALKIVTEFGDADSQRYFRDQIEREQRLSSIRDEELAQLQSALNSISNRNEKIFRLLYIAERARNSNRTVSLRLLGQVEEIIRTMPPGEERTHAEIALAMTYCLDNNDRGFAIIESLLPKLNELIDSASKLNGYDTRYLRAGEWNMSAVGSIGKLLTGLAHNAAYFAWCDFDRSISLSGQFERAEIRLMAQLKLAQGILAGRPKHLQQTSYMH